MLCAPGDRSGSAMRYKTAFRLALRAIGVLLVFWNLPQLVQMVASYVLTLFQAPASQFPQIHDAYYIVYGSKLIEHVFGILCGLYLFFGGKWIVNLAIPSNRPYCHECGYDLTGLAEGPVCPECGTPKPNGKLDREIKH